MKGTVTRSLVVGLPGLCFVIAGAITGAYPILALGGILVGESVYELSRKRAATVGARDQKRQRRSFVLAGVIGASFAITGFAGKNYLLAAGGTVLLIGSLLQLYRTTPHGGR